MLNKKFQILCIIGTRPEVIKMAPIIWQLNNYPDVNITIINTAQHRELIDDMLALFNIAPDIDINIMQKNQSLDILTGNLFLKLGEKIRQEHYDFIFAQGDTTTTFVAAQIAFYNRIPYGHIEAGLRTYDFYNPFPEEMNRVFVSKLATLHFAPTNNERIILRKEGIPDKNIFVTGNTVIDSLYYWADKNISFPFDLPKNKRLILLTLHRRESFGEPMREIFSAFLEIVNKLNDIHIIYPVHPNPNVNDLAYSMLAHHQSITLLKPLPYDIFVQLLKCSYIVCTDSGGLQEEAPALGKPLLVLREETERPLVITMGLAKLAGTKKTSIVSTVTNVLENHLIYASMQKNISPYGDGHAAEKIVDIVVNRYLKNISADA
jgi:UDP-N-acetylglucosamine 2-epimerase (non-hydrolysing)